jgi:hypothetical protein
MFTQRQNNPREFLKLDTKSRRTLQKNKKGKELVGGL